MAGFMWRRAVCRKKNSLTGFILRTLVNLPHIMVTSPEVFSISRSVLRWMIRRINSNYLPQQRLPVGLVIAKRCLLWGKTCNFKHYLDKFQVWKDGRYSSWKQPCVTALMPRSEQSNQLFIIPVKLHFIRRHIVSLRHAWTPYCWFLWNYASNNHCSTVYCTNSDSSSLNNVMASFPPCSSPHTHCDMSTDSSPTECTPLVSLILSQTNPRHLLTPGPSDDL